MNAIELELHKTVEAHLALIAERGVPVIEEMANAIVEALRRGHRLYVMGNGGSAAQAQHMAGELVGRFLKERRALPAQALSTDTSILTAVANDYDFDTVFVRQVEAFVQEDDVVMGLSTSGNSPNVVKALELARERGAATLALSGRDGGKMKDAADICLIAPGQTSPHIQEVHLTVIHVLCDLVERRMFD